MSMLSNGLIALNLLIHVWIVILEMVLWKKPLGKKTFRMSDAQAETTAVLAANQGLYNGFLAAGLLWSFLTSDAAQSQSIALFFLSCIAVAGAYGAYSVSRRIFFVQTVPALLAIASLFL